MNFLECVVFVVIVLAWNILFFGFGIFAIVLIGHSLGKDGDFWHGVAGLFLLISFFSFALWLHEHPEYKQRVFESLKHPHIVESN